MNEFIEQFMVESRELVEQANAALLALEQSPHDPELVDATFRAVHTLKGGAAIVDFFAMERAVHAAEDALSAVRAGKLSLTAALLGDCFACLDQVSRWLDSMEHTGALPLEAEAQAESFIARMAIARDAGGRAEAGERRVEARTGYSESRPSRARTIVRFTPHPASFFRGKDPLALIAAMPGLLSMELQPVDRWPSLEELDPFECMLAVTAFSAASAEAVSAHFKDHAGECQIRTLDADASGAAGVLTESSRKVLEAQIALLDAKQDATFVGRVASAGLLAANVLRHSGQAASADLIASETDRSLGANDARALQEAIARILEPASGTAVAALTVSSAESLQPEVMARSFRVDAERVDALVRLTAELTVVKNAIGHVLELATTNPQANALAGALKRPHGDLDHLIGELQSAVLGIRVLPLRTVLQRFPRLVREISAGVDKPVKLLIEGDDTEADKAIVEMLFEPLLHIVRNAMDHGIEVSQVRQQRNKPVVATLRMCASRQGSHVLVTVEDDGGGVDVARVRAVAKQRGIATSDALDAMTDEEIIELIFVAGFSTASQVTGLSGRGVGMDAVRTAVERVGGRVAITSRPGVGATIQLMLPFSVMLTHVMTVEAGGQMFGIPLDAVIETIRVPAAQIVSIGAGQAIVRRNRTIPLLALARLLQVRGVDSDSSEALIVIAAIAGQVGALQVDRLGERMQVMLKPLEGMLTGVPGVAGTTILGDGRVLLVLDLAEVLQ